MRSEGFVTIISLSLSPCPYFGCFLDILGGWFLDSSWGEDLLVFSSRWSP